MSRYKVPIGFVSMLMAATVAGGLQAQAPGPPYAERSTGKVRPAAVRAPAPAAVRGPHAIGVSWEVMAPLPAARVFTAVVASGPYVFAIGGTSDAAGGTPTNTVYRYDTVGNSWATMTPMPAALYQIDAAAIGGVIYVPGGEPDSNTYAYDVAADSWSTIATNNGYTSAISYACVTVGTDLYVMGGIRAGAATATVWKLDTLTGTWSAGVSMPSARISFAAAAIAGSIYVAGGVGFPGFAPDMTAQKFDGTSWSTIAGVPDGAGAYTRWSYAADGAGVDGLWIAGGRRDAGWAVLDHAGYYNPLSNTWTSSPTVPTLNQARVYTSGAVAANGYLHVIGGRDAAGAVIYANNERLLTNGPVPVALSSFVVD